jgi:hypothetical protein
LKRVWISFIRRGFDRLPSAWTVPKLTATFVRKPDTRSLFFLTRKLKRFAVMTWFTPAPESMARTLRGRLSSWWILPEPCAGSTSPKITGCAPGRSKFSKPRKLFASEVAGPASDLAWQPHQLCPKCHWLGEVRLCRLMCGGGYAPPTAAKLFPGYAPWSGLSPAHKSGGKPAFLTSSCSEFRGNRCRKGIHRKEIAQVQESRGREGGLAPALFARPTHFMQTSRR